MATPSPDSTTIALHDPSPTLSPPLTVAAAAAADDERKHSGEHGAAASSSSSSPPPQLPRSATSTYRALRPFTPVHVTFDQVSLTVKVKEKRKVTEKTILHNVTGVVKPGSMMACMGPSGAGKTSLLDILAMRRTKTSGRILYNGHELTPDQLKRISGYVTQADNMLPTLTVRETFEFYADLRLPKTMTREEKNRRIDDVVDQMGLRGALNTYIGSHLIRGISGGERRRVSIGVELLRQPAVLFLDEPTSGLDSSTSVKIMNVLRDLAAAGHTVICTIHQPRSSIYALFDELVLLAQGKTVYQGPANVATEYFEQLGYPLAVNVNPADHLLDLLTFYDSADPAAECKSVQDAYESSAAARQAEEAVRQTQVEPLPEIHRSQDQVGSMRQFMVLMWRASLDSARNPGLARTRIIQAVGMALLVGLIFLRLDYGQQAARSRLGAMAMIMMSSIMPTLNGVLQVFPLEKAVFLRERAANCYSTWPYYAARVTSDLPSQLFSNAIFITIVYWMMNLHATASAFFTAMAVMMITAISSQSVGMFVSALVPNAGVGAVLGPVVAVFFILFAGFFVVIDNIPVFLRWISYISFPRYTYRALVLNEFLPNIQFSCTAAEIASRTCVYQSGEQVLAGIGVAADEQMWLQFVLLIVITMFWRVAGAFALILASRNKTA